MDPLTLTVLLAVAGYCVAAPDRQTLAASRGTTGAVWAGVVGGTRQVRDDWAAGQSGRVATGQRIRTKFQRRTAGSIAVALWDCARFAGRAGRGTARVGYRTGRAAASSARSGYAPSVARAKTKRARKLARRRMAAKRRAAVTRGPGGVFFHASRAKLQAGDHLTPGGRLPDGATSQGHAWYTSQGPDVAWRMGRVWLWPSLAQARKWMDVDDKAIYEVRAVDAKPLDCCDHTSTDPKCDTGGDCGYGQQWHAADAVITRVVQKRHPLDALQSLSPFGRRPAGWAGEDDPNLATQPIDQPDGLSGGTTPTSMTGDPMLKNLIGGELTTTSDLRGEAKELRQLVEDVKESLARLNEYLAGVGDRYVGAPFGTEKLSRAISGLGEQAKAVDPVVADHILEQTDALEEALTEADQLAEHASSVKAEGEIHAFQPA